ncbi:MAG: hypothetical protein ACLGIG_06660 [Actinomycetes bacterium]
MHEWHVLQRALPRTPAAARLARVTARVACRAWRVPALEEAAAVVSSELVGLVLRRDGTGAITFRVLMTPRRLRLEVHDPTGGVPVDTAGAETAVALVDAYTVRWGVESHLPGAQLWAELPVA